MDLLLWALLSFVNTVSAFVPSDNPGLATTSVPTLGSNFPWWQAPFNVTPSNTTFPFNNYTDQCLLWDENCQGSRDVALDYFFNQSGSMWHLLYHPCEWEEHKYSSWCLPYLADSNMSSSIQSWMREPDCLTSFGEWHESHRDQPRWTYTDWNDNSEILRSINWDQLKTRRMTAGCCGGCDILGGNVDVYYWPIAGVNTDCLSIIGTSIGDPDADFFAADSRGQKYFKSKPNPWLTASTSGDLMSTSTQDRVKTVGPRFLGSFSGGSPAFNQSNTTSYTILGSTEIISGYTFTSPSIYVGFSDLLARDRCGSIGRYIDYTILAFDPGELSTIEIPNWQRVDIPSSLTKSFNLADLPCPPKHIMLNDQYKPGPGEPYRPVLAPPPRLSYLLPGWSHCKAGVLFQGLDPPKALTAAPLLAPQPTIPTDDNTAESPRPAHTPPPPGPTPTKSKSASAAKSEKSAPAIQDHMDPIDPKKTNEKANPSFENESKGTPANSRAPESWNLNNNDPSVKYSIGAALHNAFGFGSPQGQASHELGASSSPKPGQADPNTPPTVNATPGAKVQSPDDSNKDPNRQYATSNTLNWGQVQRSDPSNTVPSTAKPDAIGDSLILPASEAAAMITLTSDGHVHVFTLSNVDNAAATANANHDSGVGFDPTSPLSDSSAVPGDSIGSPKYRGASDNTSARLETSGIAVVSNPSSRPPAVDTTETTSPMALVYYSKNANGSVALTTLMGPVDGTSTPASAGGNVSGPTGSDGGGVSSPFTYDAGSGAVSLKAMKVGFGNWVWAVCIGWSVILYFK